MFVALIFLTGFVLIAVFILAYHRTKDTFHPIMFVAPMFLSLYVFLPIRLLQDGSLSVYFSPEELLFVQFVNFLGVASFCVGCLHASWRPVQFFSGEAPVLKKRILAGAFLLGTIGVVAFVVGVVNVGGLIEAYGLPFGGGWSDIGYVREAVLLCVPAITLLFLTRMGQKPMKFQWFAIAVFSMPLIIHGFLGARRGPVFLLLAVLALSWYITRFKRPRLLFFITTGLCLGIFLLFLVSNRSSFHLGSEWRFESPFSQYLKGGTGNEYIYGTGAILHADLTGDYYWGRRYFTILFIRPFPRQLWPDKYAAVGMDSIEENLGTGGSEFLWTLGWAGASGAAPGLVADVWVECWWFLVIVLYGAGWIYGRVWRAACSNQSGLLMVMYILMVSLTVFLVFQTVEAMMFRFFFMLVPTWLIWWWATARQSKYAPAFNPIWPIERSSR